MKRKQSLFVYGIIVLVSLFVIIFVWRTTDPITGEARRTITTEWWKQFKKGMDVAWWVRLHYKIDLSKYRELYSNEMEFNSIVKNVNSIIKQNIENRISALWVSDANITLQTLEDGQYVVVDLGWVLDMEEAKEIIGKTVELEFKMRYTGDGSDVRDSRQLLAESVLKDAVAQPDGLASVASQRESDDVFFQYHSKKTLEELPIMYQNNPALLAGEPGVRSTLAQGAYEVVPPIPWVTEEGATIEGRVVTKLISREALPVWTGDVTSWAAVWASQTVYTVEDILISDVPEWTTAKDPKTNEVLNGAFFKYATVGSSQTGQPVAEINFNEKGKEIFCNLTETLVGQQMAIYVGWIQMTAPVINEKICWGTAQISGNFTVESAKRLVEDLNEWALPAPLILANEEKVSASLGEKAFEWAIMAWVVGLVLVIMYMFVMYWWRQWLVSALSLISFLIVLFALIKLIGYALSLSGLAAILLSIGMGVDANVLIFERSREEMALSKAVENAVIDGYERSRSAIRDGNITTWMIALLLFLTGTNVFKGFGTMMLVNIAITLMVLVPLTKYLLIAFYQWEK